MADQVLIRRSGHQELDTLDAADIPALAYDASGAAAAAQSAATAAAATDATTKANAAASGAASALSTHDADTTAVHGIANTANLYVAGGTDVAVADGGTGAGTASGARTNLGLVIGTDIPAYMDGKQGGHVLPTGALAETFPRYIGSTNASILSTGRLQLAAIMLPAGLTITSITWVSGTQALSAGANQWFGIFSDARAKLRLTGDDTTTAWAANSAKTLNLSSQFITTYAGLHYIGCMVKATTVPSLSIATTSGSGGVVQALAPIVFGSSTTGLTDPASCPDPAGAIASSGGPMAYAYVS